MVERELDDYHAGTGIVHHPSRRTYHLEWTSPSIMVTGEVEGDARRNTHSVATTFGQSKCWKDE